MSAFISPVFGAGAQLFDNTGLVLSGGKITTYVAGSTTLQATWTDSAQGTQNANPIICNSAGRPANNSGTPTEIWLANGVAYKFVVSDSNNNVIGTFDNIPGVNVTSFSVSQWVTSGLVVTYASATTFTVPGDQTTIFTANQRVQYTLNSGTYYGYVVSSSYSNPTTTVTIAPDSTNLDNTLAVVNYGLITATNTSIPQQFVIAAADKVPARSAGTANQVLTNNGTTSAWSTFPIAIQTFTTNGTYTPTTGMRYCIVDMVGSGAGGITAAAGNYGGAGGGAGEYATGGFTAAQIGASKAVTIGTAGAVDTNGATTSLGALLTAVGGSKGTSVYIAGLGGSGGTGTGLHSPGGDGGMGTAAFTGPQTYGGQGGASYFGSGGAPGYGNLGHATPGRAYGSGGGGNGNISATFSNAAAGASGVMVIYEFG